MERIAEIKESIGPGQPIEQLLPGKTQALKVFKVMVVAGRFLIEQTIRILQSVFAQPPLENTDT